MYTISFRTLKFSRKEVKEFGSVEEYEFLRISKGGSTPRMLKGRREIGGVYKAL